MEIKIIDINVDKITGKKYYLGKVNVNELSNYIKKIYKGIDFDRFNNKSIEKLKEKILTEHEIKDIYKKNQEEYASLNMKEKTYEEFKKDHIEYSKSRFNSDVNRLIEEENKQQMIFNTAVENNFISIWGKFDIINSKVKLNENMYLLDGFRRLLFDFKYLNKSSDKVCYIKIYNELTNDQDIMNMMLHLNLWKLPQGITTWFDRGWRLFIFKRLNIEMNMIHFKLFDNYFSSDYIELKKVVTSEYFYDDLKEINKLIIGLNLPPDERYYFDKEFSYIYSLVRVLGKRRKDGNTQRFNHKLFNKFIKININEIRRISLMEVYGHYIKPINALIKLFFETMDDPVKLKIMNNTDENNIQLTNVTSQEFIGMLGEDIKKDFGIRVSKNNGRFIVVKDKYMFHYTNKKLYVETKGVVGVAPLRIYFFFGNKYLFKRDKSYHILSVGDYPQWEFYDDKINHLTKEDAIKIINDFAKTKYTNLPNKETIFIYKEKITGKKEET